MKTTIWPCIKKWVSRFIMSLGVLFLLCLISALTWMSILFGGSNTSLPDEMVLRIVAEDGFYETGNPNPLAAFSGDAAYGVHDLSAALRRAAADERVKAVVISIKGGGYGYAHINEIHRAMDAFKQSGKPLYAYATGFGGASSGMDSYYLASGASEIWLQPVGVVGITGFFMQVPFFKGLMDKLGIQADIVHKGDYKSAPESIMRTEMSEANKEMSTTLMRDYYVTFVADVARYRQIGDDAVRKAIDDAPLSEKQAIALGFVDTVGYKDRLIDRIRETTGDIDWVDAAVYEAHMRKKDNVQRTVALITVDGVIANQAGQGKLMGGDTVDLSGVIRNLEAAKDDENCVGVVLRINSPGGTPEAAEELRRAVTRVNGEKPVVVSMGNVAASGGYWIAVNARRIFAEAMTLTGSIGVFGGKIGLSALLDKAGINLDGVKIGKDADMWSMEKIYTPVQRQKIEAVLKDVYDAFVERVAFGRGQSVEMIDKLAKGRVYTGNQALQNGLVDEIGGVEEAAASVRRLADVDDAGLVAYHEPFDFMDVLFGVIRQATLVWVTPPLTSAMAMETTVIR